MRPIPLANPGNFPPRHRIALYDPDQGKKFPIQ